MTTVLHSYGGRPGWVRQVVAGRAGVILDAELVAAVLAGDREAFGPLLERWHASSLRLCRRLLGPGQQAEDVAQETAVQAFLGLPSRPGRAVVKSLVRGERPDATADKSRGCESRAGQHDVENPAQVPMPARSHRGEPDGLGAL